MLSEGEDELVVDFLEVAESAPAKSGRKRKSQTEEEFERQKQIYKDGPTVQTEDWLFNIKSFDPTSKVDRGHLKNAAERAYYLKDYNKALDIVSIADDWDLGTKDRQELDAIKQHCHKSLQA